MEVNVIYASTEEGDSPSILTPQQALPLCSDLFNNDQCTDWLTKHLLYVPPVSSSSGCVLGGGAAD